MDAENEIKGGPRILFIYPDRLFNDFIKNFLELKGFVVRCSTDNVEGIRYGINFAPGLIIMNKDFPNLDAEGFIIKKKTLHALAELPLFLIGDFSPEELVKFKQENVQAFISSPLNPIALLERLNIFYEIKTADNVKRTPMLLDLHVKTNVIIAQIEGNFEPIKLELFNFLIRSYCVQKKIRTPKVFIIIPSLYPESITEENIKLLFKFMSYHEIQLDYRYVKLLTVNEKVIQIIKSNKDFVNFEFVSNYAAGIQSLQINFDKQKSIPVHFLKVGSSYIFDLYDSRGRKMIPAMTKLSENTLEKIKKLEISRLTYYSDKDINEITNLELAEEESSEIVDDALVLDLITEDFEPIETEIKVLRILDQKQTLFFRKMKGQNILIISPDADFKNVITSALDIYFNIEQLNTGKNIADKLKDNNYTLIFIDSDIQAPEAVEILKTIRSGITRRQTSIIILTRKIDKVSVIRYRDCGTNNILLSPLSTSRIEQAVFDSITADRRT